MILRRIELKFGVTYKFFPVKIILFVISRNSIISKWTTYEVRMAVEKGAKIIPILIEDVDVTSIPDPIARI